MLMSLILFGPNAKNCVKVYPGAYAVLPRACQSSTWTVGDSHASTKRRYIGRLQRGCLMMTRHYHISSRIRGFPQHGFNEMPKFWKRLQLPVLGSTAGYLVMGKPCPSWRH
mmetsp:Transcript_103184/g.230515  ORF Transcript_103184/g.230515 Transcript_103184/m.230515 type:complete len:111 (-) Transcript_103184:1-333(-)